MLSPAMTFAIVACKYYAIQDIQCDNLPDKLLSIIRAVHDHYTAAICAYSKTSDEFAVTSGVLQGCVLAPALFNLYFGE